MSLINRMISADPAERKRTPISMTAIRFSRVPAVPSILGSERGVALVMALILGLVGLLMVGSLLYMAGTGIWVSGSKNRYRAALESAHGGLIFFNKEIIQRGVSGATLSSMVVAGGFLNPVISDANFTTKLGTTGLYAAVNPDATLIFPAVAPKPNMTVSTTILATSRGNSAFINPNAPQNPPMPTGGVLNTTPVITPPHYPYLYQSGIQAQSANTQENARLSSIYVY